MTDPLSTAGDDQLAEWAFGRQGVVTDRELAEAALRELARRSEVAKAEAEADAQAAEELEASRAGSMPSPTQNAPSRTRVARWGIVLAAALALATIVTILLVVVDERPTSSLAVFDREPTAAELDLSVVVAQELLDGEVEARILADSPTATVVAFRSTSPTSASSSTVCVAVVEFAVASGSTCTSVDDFASDGMAFIVRGRTGLIAVDWGPHGEADIRLPDDFEVGPSGG